jgi:hypothetical protein
MSNSMNFYDILAYYQRASGGDPYTDPEKSGQLLANPPSNFGGGPQQHRPYPWGYFPPEYSGIERAALHGGAQHQRGGGSPPGAGNAETLALLGALAPIAAAAAGPTLGRAGGGGAKDASQQYASTVNQAAVQNGVEPWMLNALIQAESSWNPNAKSPAGAVGLGQLMPGTAKELGVSNPRDPEQNIYGSAAYLGRMLDQFKDPSLALAAYNAGPGAVKKHGGIPPYKETQNYVQKVMGAAPAAGAMLGVMGATGAARPQIAAATPPMDGQFQGTTPAGITQMADGGRRYTPAAALPTDEWGAMKADSYAAMGSQPAAGSGQPMAVGADIAPMIPMMAASMGLQAVGMGVSAAGAAKSGRDQKKAMQDQKKEVEKDRVQALADRLRERAQERRNFYMALALKG